MTGESGTHSSGHIWPCLGSLPQRGMEGRKVRFGAGVGCTTKGCESTPQSTPEFSLAIHKIMAFRVRVWSREDHVHAVTLHLDLRVAVSGGGPASGRQTNRAGPSPSTRQIRGKHRCGSGSRLAASGLAGARSSLRHHDSGSPAGESGVRQLLRWARRPDDDRLHLLAPAEVPRGTAKDHARALRGQRIPAKGLPITSSPAWALCVTCVLGIPAEMLDPGSRTTAPQIAGRPPVEPLTPGFGSRRPASHPATPR